jgi:hypothetical protein
LMEVFCAANHGQTFEFESRDGQIHPVLKEKVNISAVAWGLEIQQEAILKFAKIALDNGIATCDLDSLRPLINSLFDEFWNRPTRTEARTWGMYAYADDQTESHVSSLAEPFRVFDWVRCVYWGKIIPPNKAGWASGGLLRSAPWIRLTLKSGMSASRWLRHSWNSSKCN